MALPHFTSIQELTIGLNIDLHDPLNLARACAAILDEKKVSDLESFDVSESVYFTSYFVLGTGLNARHLQTAVDHLEQSLKERGIRRIGLEGYRDGKWVLLDLGEVVVHLFLSEARQFYDLGLLWGDSPRIDLSLPAAPRREALT
jgi:ribosome-associated protein